MKITRLLIIGALLFPAISQAKDEKINWTPCKKELAEYCTTYSEDVEKHECLEEAPQAKISKSCLEFNKKQEAKLGGKGTHKH